MTDSIDRFGFQPKGSTVGEVVVNYRQMRDKAEECPEKK